MPRVYVGTCFTQLKHGSYYYARIQQRRRRVQFIGNSITYPHRSSGWKKGNRYVVSLFIIIFCIVSRTRCTHRILRLSKLLILFKYKHTRATRQILYYYFIRQVYCFCNKIRKLYEIYHRIRK